MDYLVSGLLSITWQQWVMYVVGAVLIYLAVKKEFCFCQWALEPS